MGIGVAVPVVAAGGGFAVDRVIKIKVAKRLDEREALADGDIYQKVYAASGYAPTRVAELWHEIARELPRTQKRVPPPVFSLPLLYAASPASLSIYSP